MAPSILVTMVLSACLSMVLPGQIGARAAPAGITYHGGTVVTIATTYAIFWLPAGTGYTVPPVTGTPYPDLMDRYLRDVGGTSYYAVLGQYAPASPSAATMTTSLGGSWVDSRPYPHAGTAADPLPDTDLQAEVARALRLEHWPTGPSSLFFVFTAAGIQSCRQSNGSRACTFPDTAPQCGWHSTFQPGDQPIIYAVLPDAWTIPGCIPDPSLTQSPNGDLAADSEIPFLAHEQVEMVTNPFGDGWHDGENFEIADKCQGASPGAGTNGAVTLLHGNPYVVPRIWSNADGSCVLADALPPSPTPAAAPSPTPAPPSPTSISASPTLPPATPTSTPPGVLTATSTPSPARPRKLSFHRETCRKGFHLVHNVCRRHHPRTVSTPPAKRRRGVHAASIKRRRGVHAASRLPERSIGQEHVEDRTESPNRADDNPQNLLHRPHIRAPQNVDPGQDHGKRMQDDRDDHFQQEFHDSLLDTGQVRRR